jgi:hypothetical protein
MNFFSKLFSRLPDKLSDKGQNKAANARDSGISALKLMLFIVDWNQIEVIFSALKEKKVVLDFISKGRGTATSDTLDLLGIDASDKAVIACLEQPGNIPALLKEVRKKLAAHGPGTGIAFTVPLSAINSPILRTFKRIEGEITGDDKESSGNYSHALIFSIVNRGYSDEFMNCARKAGASGGTVLNARDQAHDGSVKLFGTTLQEEREIIITLTSKDKKESIMKALSEMHGLDSKAQGIILSLPVERAMSLSYEVALDT